MYKFTLYYDQKVSYQGRIKAIVSILEKIREKWNVDSDVIDVGALEHAELEQVKNSIRNIMPQARGKIVSSKNKVLPLSKSKNLNTKNTPVLLLTSDRRPINVYPHMLGTAYFEIETQLEKMLESGPEAHMTAKGLLEEPMQKILADDPSVLEEGMQFRDANIDVGFGVADVLLQDTDGRIVVVEIETKTTEAAVAQVSRLAAGYASQHKLSKEFVRKVILCQQYDERAAKACEGANVELYQLITKKVC